MTLQQLVNKYLWHLGPSRLLIRYKHRVGDVETYPAIYGHAIAQAPGRGIMLKNNKLIPWHRVICVIDLKAKPTLMWGELVDDKDKKLVWNADKI